ncbi:MAG: CRTAC1 family protein [Thermoguttaceae bacterium]
MQRLLWGRKDSRGAGWVEAAAVVLACLAGCCDRPVRQQVADPLGSACQQGPIQLCDVTDQTGISFVHTDGSSGAHYIVETVTAGLATFDYDGDGLIDIYFVNGAPLRGTAAQRPPRNALYKNLGGLCFKDVTDEAGVGDPGFGLGVAVADYDNDGDLDIYVSNYGPNVLYRNNGDGTFTDVTGPAGVADGHKVGAGPAFLDIDGDGDLDLYVANYVKFTYENHIRRLRYGYPEYASPREYPPENHTLFRNNGDGTFTDISAQAGIARHAGTGMGVVCADYDRDGDTDIFVLNDVSRNFFLRNDGAGRFEEVAIPIGAAFNAQGDSLGSMGVDCGDFDNDGWLDFYQTSYQGELPVLFRNLGNGTLEDVTLLTGAGGGTLACVKWGCGFGDLDNDGDRDLLVAMGHLQDLIDYYDDTTSFHARNVLLINQLAETGRARFLNLSEVCGEGLGVKLSSRGLALDDLDNDGDIDAVILNTREKPTVLRNMLDRSGCPNRWLQVELRGVKTNRDGVGAQVKVVSGDLMQIDEVHSGRGYQGHFGSRLHFGLGKRDRVDRIEVRWIGGGVDLLEDLDANRLVTIVEGSGKAAGGAPREKPFGQ